MQTKAYRAAKKICLMITMLFSFSLMIYCASETEISEARSTIKGSGRTAITEDIVEEIPEEIL